MVGRELASRFFEDRTRPRTTVRPSVRTLTFYVLSYACAHATQVPHRQASTPRDVSDQALPELSNFFACYVARVRGKAWERGYTTCGLQNEKNYIIILLSKGTILTRYTTLKIILRTLSKQEKEIKHQTR